MTQTTDGILRIGGALCSLWLLSVAITLQSYSAALGSVRAAFFEAALVGFFLLLAFESMTAQLPKRFTLHVVVAILCGLAALMYSQAQYIAQFNNNVIGSDTMALSIAAAQSLLHGHNPYATDLSRAYHGLSQYAISRGEDGSVATSYPYPALLFLCYLPVVALKANPLWVGGIAVATALVVIVAMAPAALRTIAPLSFLVLPLSIGFVGLGVLDVLFVVPLMAAAYLWTELPFAAAVCLGLACAIKQEPWLDLPVFLLGVAMGTGALLTRRAARFGLAALGVLVGFLIPNAYFFAIGPREWVQGVFRPLFVPYAGSGVGIVNLSITGFAHASRMQLDVAVWIALLAILLVGWRWFPAVRNGLWLTPGIAIFFAPRSPASDFAYLIPVCLASWFGMSSEALAWKENLRVRKRL